MGYEGGGLGADYLLLKRNLLANLTVKGGIKIK
jgi:hypothetical protein